MILPLRSPGTGKHQGTIANYINDGGSIAGYYIDANNADHDFLRAADGTVSTFDAPGAGAGSGQLSAFCCNYTIAGADLGIVVLSI